MVVFGYMLMGMGVLVMGLVALSWYARRKGIPIFGIPVSAPGNIAPSEALPMDRLDHLATPKDKLKVITKGQTVTLTDDLRERAVLASVTLHEMTQVTDDAPWSRTGVESKGVLLAGDVWIWKIPGRESGKPAWFKGTELETFPLESFYKGEDDPALHGPARKFFHNGQSAPVPYELPNDLTPGITWNLVDIGRFEASVDGSCENIEEGDMLYFVTSREKSGDRFLLYLDARKGEARGTGGLFLGTPFEPSVDVMELF